MAIPGLLALGVLAAIVVPDGAHLGWPRLTMGFAAYLTVNIGASAILSRNAARR